MQLTTPELKEYDSVFPGENWFFYWKTSPSLWTTKLREYQGEQPIFIPIYWGLHNEHAGQYDFGTYKPETDLAKLASIAEEVGKQIVAILPLVPSPFLTNGGIPTFLARTLSQSSNGLAISMVDSENRLNKIYSMFDPRVFQAYRKFTWHFGQFLSRKGVAWEVFGGDFGFLSDGRFQSFMRDSSPIFEQGFSRYVKQLQSTEPEKVDRLQNSPLYEFELKEEFHQQIESLYLQAAEEATSASWGGTIRFAFLGGSPTDIFSRTSELWENEFNFFKPLFEMITLDLIPSSSLLGPAFKKGILNKCLRDQVSASMLQYALKRSFFDEDAKASFMPLVFFNIFGSKPSFVQDRLVKQLGLDYFVYRDYRWTLRKVDQVELDDDFANKVFFFFGEYLGLEDLNVLIKLFMNGAKVILDTHNIHGELQRRLNQFIHENDFKVEDVKFKTNLKRIALGDGQFIIYDHGPLLEFNSLQKVGFWNSIVNFLNIKHLKFEAPDDVFYFWRSRLSNTYELNYEEIRRLSLYNPTSYKKKVQINSSSNFAYLKSLDQIRCDIKSSPLGIDIELLPGGSVSLDYGYYE